MLENIPIPHRQCLSFLLSHFHNKMLEKGLTYWVEGGALLGFERSGKFIPHDDDIDVCMLFQDTLKPQFLEVLEYMKTLSVDIPNEDGSIRKERVIVENKPEQQIIKIAVPKMWAETSEGDIIGTPTLDIFTMEKKSDKYRLYSLAFRRRFANCYFLKDELFPLRVVEIEGVSCLVPKDGKPYLLRYYGQDCLSVVKREARQKENPLHKKYTE